MFREELKYIKDYFRVVELNPWLFSANFITSVIYKILDVARPFVAAQIIDKLTEQDATGAVHAIILYAGIYIAYRLFLFLNWRTYSWNVSYCYLKLQDKLFNKILSVDHSFKKKVNRGRLLNIIGNDLFEIGEMNDEISELITSVFQVVFIIAISAFYSPLVAFIMAVSVTAYSHMRTRHDRKYNYYWWRSQNENDNYSNFLNQILTGLQEVKVFNLRSPLHQRLDMLQKRYDKNYLAQRKETTSRDNDVRFIYYPVRALILLICIVMMANGTM